MWNGIVPALVPVVTRIRARIRVDIGRWVRFGASTFYTVSCTRGVADFCTAAGCGAGGTQHGNVVNRIACVMHTVVTGFHGRTEGIHSVRRLVVPRVGVAPGWCFSRHSYSVMLIIVSASVAGGPLREHAGGAVLVGHQSCRWARCVCGAGTHSGGRRSGRGGCVAGN